MFKRFIPHYHAENVCEIPLEWLKEKKLILFDVDNTLFYPETTTISDKILVWSQKVKKQFTCVCVSNSPNIQKRKEAIENLIGCDVFLSNHKKPSKYLFREILEKYNVQPSDVVMIGNQRFTDVPFGKINKSLTILVEPLVEEKRLFVWIARRLEKIMFRRKHVDRS